MILERLKLRNNVGEPEKGVSKFDELYYGYDLSEQEKEQTLYKPTNSNTAIMKQSLAPNNIQDTYHDKNLKNKDYKQYNSSNVNKYVKFKSHKFVRKKRF
jgi:hypothetical protein